jgi:hypothetical protein
MRAPAHNGKLTPGGMEGGRVGMGWPVSAWTPCRQTKGCGHGRWCALLLQTYTHTHTHTQHTAHCPPSSSVARPGLLEAASVQSMSLKGLDEATYKDKAFLVDVRSHDQFKVREAGGRWRGGEVDH